MARADDGGTLQDEGRTRTPVVVARAPVFIGVLTFARSVVLSFEDARCVAGMNLLRRGYLDIVPELEPYFITGHEPLPDRRGLAHGAPQHQRNVVNSLNTISSVVAALTSILAGALASDLAALLGASPLAFVTLGAAVSLASASAHVYGAARFRRSHAPT
jgi:hypothetical protein